jgi:hypothetical protein
MPLTSLHRW